MYTNLYAPDYYSKFRCIANKCSHNCCIGWEIDIDKETLLFYNTINNSFGKKLKQNISNSDTPHFLLSDNERCPFLNESNLCEIIINLGENSLCQICTDHPRFRNFFNSRTEIGLGLCCESAAKLILSEKNKFKITEILSIDIIIDEEEDVFFNFRNKIFEIIQDNNYTISTRIYNLLEFCKINYNFNGFNRYINLYKRLEYINSDLLISLSRLENNQIYNIKAEWNSVFEQLIIYFIYRHLSDCLYDGLFRERILFCILSFEIIYNICKTYKEPDFDIIVDIARIYSTEIEYSEYNISTILEYLKE